MSRSAWADLEKLQGASRPDGTTAVVIRDERTTAAITEARHLSILFAISRVSYARTVLAERYAGNGAVIYMTAGMPPEFLVEAVSSAGGVVFDGARDHALAKPPELTVLLDGAFCDLAIAVKRRLKVRSMSDAIEVREIELRRRPVDAANSVMRWTAVYELMALAGEAVRDKRPGRWIHDREQKVRFPLVLDLGGGAKLAPGRMAEMIVAGGGGSMRQLFEAVEVASSALPIGNARLIPLLHDRRVLPSEDVVWEPLIDNECDTPDLPVIAYVEDGNETYRWPKREQITPQLRERALGNLGARAFHVAVNEVPELGITLAFVSGDFYASEAILHRPTMKQVEAKLGAEVLLVGVPARGHLIAVDSTVMMNDENMLRAFLLLVEKHYLANVAGARISSEVIVYHGKPIGRVQSNLMDSRRALRRVGVDPDA